MTARRTSRRRLLVALVAAALIGAIKLTGTDLSDLGLHDSTFADGGDADAPGQGASASSPSWGTYQVRAGELEKLLHQVDVVDERPEISGYDRECGTDHACSFGPAWTDDVDVDLGHNGCDTRNDILRRDLSETTYREGTSDCVVVAGTLADPYTGERIDFAKAEAYKVGIDHIYPLARAWDLGASQWPETRRRDFANDPRNLLAVSGSANSSKSDHGPGEWLPVNGAYRCRYAATYLQVAYAYRLPITAADHATVSQLQPTCGT